MGQAWPPGFIRAHGGGKRLSRDVRFPSLASQGSKRDNEDRQPRATSINKARQASLFYLWQHGNITKQTF
ncbi:hypothetical protein HMPREF1640_00630 [Prevotella sp. S7-1-8]|nr:hypothetical protein HMPREF1640_00630 [Prevotella sp. S7-1-8]